MVRMFDDGDAGGRDRYDRPCNLVAQAAGMIHFNGIFCLLPARE